MLSFRCRSRAASCWILIRVALGVAAVLSVGQASHGRAADTETRDFSVHIDGKESGLYRMTIERRDDGTVSMAAQASIQVKKLGITVYRYTYAGTEVWKDGKERRLLGMTSSCDDNGKRYEVNVTTDANGLRVRVNGQERLVRADSWTMTYWKLPDARFHNQAVPLLDADTGKEFQGRLDYVGTEQLSVAGQVQTCYHFRVSGGPYPVEVWFDAQHRLVRQDFTEEGHRTILQFVTVRR
jgi:hypothetical protein